VEGGRGRPFHWWRTVHAGSCLGSLLAADGGPSGRFQKRPSGDERNRHAAEDALAEDLNARGAHGVPGYKLLPNEIRGDAEDTLARLKEAGANEVVLMRVVGADKRPSFTEVRWTASNGDERREASNATGVTELRHFDTRVSVETLVCSLDRDEPLWSSTSRITNPKDIENLVNEVADATTTEMVKQGLLARQ
jgi:hypothetical protein